MPFAAETNSSNLFQNVVGLQNELVPFGCLGSKVAPGCHGGTACHRGATA